MPHADRGSTLELDDDEPFHRANWVAERIGWVCILVVILLGLSGLMGRGPLGETTASQGALRVRYDHVMRRSSPGTMDINIGPRTAREAVDGAAADTVVRLWVSSSLIGECQTFDVVPAPAQTIQASDKTVMLFPAVSAAASSTITIMCEPEAVGRYSGSIGLVNGPQLPLRISVLP